MADYLLTLLDVGVGSLWCRDDFSVVQSMHRDTGRKIGVPEPSIEVAALVRYNLSECRYSTDSQGVPMKRLSYPKFWEAVVAAWRAIGDPHLIPGKTGASHLPLGPAGSVHYEWQLHSSTSTLDVALDFELSGNQAENLRRAELVNRQRKEIERGMSYAFCCGFFGDQSARAKFIIPYSDLITESPRIAAEAARVMLHLIARTRFIVKGISESPVLTS